MQNELSSLKLNRNQYEAVCRRLYDLCGISLKSGKEELVQSRLSKRVSALQLKNFDEYLSYVERDSNELVQMIDALTTNKTSFFREPQHFKFMSDVVLPNFHGDGLRIWSAACSSGEEPYSIAITLLESSSNPAKKDVKILATDISTRVLEKARRGVYENEVLHDVPANRRQKHFTAFSPSTSRVNDNVKKMISFARLNLMGAWAMKGQFNVIFCRNVMIYFDKETQTKLVNRFYDYLVPGGYLFIGHSESFIGVSHRYNYVQPAVYQK